MDDVKTRAQQWQRVKTILADALEHPSPEDRTAYLERLCGGDTTLMREVEALLAQSTGNLDELAANTPTAFARAAPAQPPGRRIGSYEIVRELGRGGMGAVYLAKRADGQFEREVAIKLLKRGTDTDEILRRFRAERRILARLEHPNIARLLDAGTTDDGLPYFVMEHVEGQSITEYARHAKLPITERLELFVKVCSAVEAAHANHIVHRDLKASNILVRSDGEPKLLDFGIAKLLEPSDDAIVLTVTDQRRFTAVCVSPEQARGESVTPASDVYALGALLYELLIDFSPHRFATRQPGADEIVRVVCEVEPVRPSLAVGKAELRRQLRGDLDTVILTALAKEPGRRYASASGIAEDIQRYLSGRPIVARKSRALYRARRFLRRNWRWIIFGVVLAASGSGLGYFVFRSNPRLPAVSVTPSPADIPEKATQDKEAYQEFLKARTLTYEFGTDHYQQSLISAVQLLESATKRDSRFALAYSLLAESQMYLYERYEATDAHLRAAKAAADAAQRLAPDSHAAHFAQAIYFYAGPRDMLRAEAEIVAALRALPTSIDALELAPKIERRLGRFKDALDHCEKAIQIDPRDPALIPIPAEIYNALRRYEETQRVIDRALAVLPPQFAGPLWQKKAAAALAQGDTKGARAAMEASARHIPTYDFFLMHIAVCERDFPRATELAGNIKSETMQKWVLVEKGLIARARGDEAGARDDFSAARAAIEKDLMAQPDDSNLLSYLALVEAGLGENDEALRQAQRAVDRYPVSRDAVEGAHVARLRAQVYAWVGQTDAALNELANLMSVPYALDYGQLALDPVWDSLRNDRRFAQLLEQARRPIDPIPNGNESAATSAAPSPRFEKLVASKL
jgi:serine/threonine protein kinase/tetratricopeptide (TPR) repeat protein